MCSPDPTGLAPLPTLPTLAAATSPLGTPAPRPLPHGPSEGPSTAANSLVAS